MVPVTTKQLYLINHYEPFMNLWTIINHYEPLLTIMNHYEPLWTIINHQPVAVPVTTQQLWDDPIGSRQLQPAQTASFAAAAAGHREDLQCHAGRRRGQLLEERLKSGGSSLGKSMENLAKSRG